jgi:hypothetical protein
MLHTSIFFSFCGKYNSICVDNKSALILINNPIFSWTEQAHPGEVALHPRLLRGRSFKVCYMNTKDQLMDLLTKPLGMIKFLNLCSMIEMVQLSHKTTQKT